MDIVAAFAAHATATLVMLAITAGWRRAGSDASAGNLSLLPCAQRYSIVTS